MVVLGAIKLKTFKIDNIFGHTSAVIIGNSYNPVKLELKIKNVKII